MEKARARAGAYPESSPKRNQGCRLTGGMPVTFRDDGRQGGGRRSMHCSIWPDDLAWALRRLAMTDLRDHAPELPDFYIAVVHPSTSVCECCNVIRRFEFVTHFDMPLCVKDIRPVPCHPAHQLQSNRAHCRYC